MKNLLLINSSPNLLTSVSRHLADIFVKKWSVLNEDAKIIKRDIGKSPIPHLLSDSLEGIIGSTEVKSELGKHTRKLSDELIQELRHNDIWLIASPMHNFGISSSLKAYFDHIIRYGITVASKEFTEKQVVLITVGGGQHAGSDHDFQTPHVRYLLHFIGIKPEQIHVIHAQRTLYPEEIRLGEVVAATQKLEELAIKLSKIKSSFTSSFPTNDDYLYFSAKLFESVKNKSYETCGIDTFIPKKMDILDVGCGIGVDTLQMSSYLTPDSKVIGIDKDPKLVSFANAQAYKQQKPLVNHYEMDCTNIPYKEEFDCARSERLFQHLENPAEILQKMAQAVKDQGIVVVIDTDWESLSSKVLSESENQSISKHYSTTAIKNGTIAKNLFGLFNQIHLAEVKEHRIKTNLTKEEYCRITRHAQLFKGIFKSSDYDSVMSKIDKYTEEKDKSFGHIDSVIVSGMKSRL